MVKKRQIQANRLLNLRINDTRYTDPRIYIPPGELAINRYKSTFINALGNRPNPNEFPDYCRRRNLKFLYKECRSVVRGISVGL